jgi:hypothetical protein
MVNIFAGYDMKFLYTVLNIKRMFLVKFQHISFNLALHILRGNSTNFGKKTENSPLLAHNYRVSPVVISKLYSSDKKM